MKISTEFKVGITVLISSVILILGIIWGKEFRLKTNKYNIQIVFEQVGGLVPGDPVTVNGVREGKVLEVGWRDRDVLCTIELNDHIQLFEDATFSVISSELLAGMKIEIFPGRSTRHINLSQQPFQGSYGGRIVDVGLIIGDLAGDMSRLSFRIDTTVTLINNILKSGRMQSDLQASLANIHAMTNEFKKLPADFRKITEEIAETTARLNQFIDNNSASMDSTISVLAQLSSRLDSMSVSMNHIITGIENQEGSLGKMIYDTTLYYNLNKTLKSIDSLSVQIKEKGLDIDIF
ncbi:MAG TPA: MCE family protein [Caldithrix abyssi]|uniref:MCE family protein n=1 Tax=Caldithrix abyssi TaxID=187145 RepID=A0A7V4TXG2_CALAY|nr:MCE family protein [Caldithrix abyssi]